jgi:hypothetical protein
MFSIRRRWSLVRPPADAVAVGVQPCADQVAVWMSEAGEAALFGDLVQVAQDVID